MIDTYTRPATLHDAAWLAPRLRPEDAAEVHASLGCSAFAALATGVTESDPARVMLAPDGEPVGMYGVVPVDDGAGAVWLLATPGLVAHSRLFLRNTRPAVEALHARYPLLFNYVDARNEVHIRWLRWAGFTFIRRHERHGHAGLPFLEFVRIPSV